MIHSSSFSRAGAGILTAVGVSLSESAPAAEPLKWEQHDGYREAELRVPATGKPGFTLLRPEQTGVFFTNSLSYTRSEVNQNLMNGCGVAAGDYDGDGWPDLYFANTDGPNGLFRNLGNWHFENTTARARVEATNQATKGVVFADVNGDGRLDLVAAGLGGPNACFVNLGDGRFTNVTAAAGLISKAGAHSLALADVDGDGDLDLYLANYGEISVFRSGGAFSVRTINGKPTVTGRYAKRLRIIGGSLIELGEPDALYLNDGKGIFAPVSWTGGSFLTERGQPLKSEPADMGLSVMFRDINGDGAPDIYVCNDFQTPDRIWINDGRGHFRALPDRAVRKTCHFSMGVDFADVDRDGLDDFFVGDMLSRSHELRMRQLGATNPPPAHVGEDGEREQVRRNTLNWNRGDGTYAEVANFAGLNASDWTWSVVFVDVDLDGFEDLLVVNGHGYDTQDLDMHEKSPEQMATGSGMTRIGKSLKNFPPLITPNYVFRNRGNLTFEERGGPWGFDSTNVSHGIALADFDNDGDLDAAVSCLWQPPLLYRNESTAPRVAVRLKGLPPNTKGIGARIRVLGGAVPSQTQEIHCGGRYLSADDMMRTFAAGSLTNAMTIEVAWRSGKRSVITGARPNRGYELDEAGAKAAAPQPPVRRTPTIFKDVSAWLAHANTDSGFNDMERQPLLHKTLSKLGPAVAWADLDRDGRDELIVSAGEGRQLAIFSYDSKGSFNRWTDSTVAAPLSRDWTALASFSPGHGETALLAGLSTYRQGGGSEPVWLALQARSGGFASAVSFVPQATARNPDSSAGPVAVADLDGDEDLDVFVGGRVVAGRYPEAATSQIYRNEGGALKLDEVNSALLKQVGLVSAACFSDLSGDGYAELVLTCEWGPLKIFRNDHGRLAPWDAPVTTLDSRPSTLRQLLGWWTSVTTGDLDSDGRLDLVAGNWGLNSSYGDPSQHPLRFYYGDFDGNETIELLETETEGKADRLLPRRDMGFLSAGMPWLHARFPTHKAFSTADVNTILSEHSSRAQSVQANTLASMIFLNRGDHFEARPLPGEAQWAPVFGLNVVDMDGDGNEDVFLAQNFFAMRLEEPRLDAGRGLLLRGDGNGGLKSVPAQESGIKIPGDQRGSATCDFDGDGRTDLVVAENGGPTMLFQNERAKPGLRVRLQGPPANPSGIGAVLRLSFGDKSGPIREIHGGSGYWSQDSAVQVLATPQTAAKLEVRWPGGKAVTVPVPASAREVTVDANGQVK